MADLEAVEPAGLVTRRGECLERTGARRRRAAYVDQARVVHRPVEARRRAGSAARGRCPSRSRHRAAIAALKHYCRLMNSSPPGSEPEPAAGSAEPLPALGSVLPLGTTGRRTVPVFLPVGGVLGVTAVWGGGGSATAVAVGAATGTAGGGATAAGGAGATVGAGATAGAGITDGVGAGAVGIAAGCGALGSLGPDSAITAAIAPPPSTLAMPMIAPHRRGSAGAGGNTCPTEALILDGVSWRMLGSGVG